MSDVLLSFGVQNAQADVNRMIGELESAFSNSDPVKIKVGLEVDKAALGTFKSQLSQIVNSISLSNGAPITVKINGLGEISSKTEEVKKSLEGVSKGAKSAAASLDQMTKTQARDRLNEISRLLVEIRENAAKWSEAQNSDSSDAYNTYTAQADALEKLRADIEAGSVSLSEYTQRMSEIKIATDSAATTLSKFGKSADEIKMLEAGTKEYHDALKKTVTLLDSVTKHQKDWTKAKSGTSSESYSDLAAYQKQLEGLIDDLQKGTLSVKDFKERFAAISSGVKIADNAIKSAGENTKTLGERIQGLVTKFSSWLSVSQAVMFALNSVKKMVTTVIELDTAMTELKKVTDETDATYERFLNNAVSRAKSVGASLTDVVTATADFARLGYDINEASTLADTAIVYKNVADGLSDINEASESIISTMQAFGIETSNAMSIVDKFNNVSNNFAISSAGIGEALQRSAAAMNAAGNNLDQTIALITAANTVVQNPDSVGTTLKTVSMFLRAAKTEAEEAGESTEGMANSVSELRQELLDLTGQKVDIQLDENTFKSTYQILQELAGVWGDLSDISQANILELIGGKRNSNVVSALLENFNIAEDVLKTSMNSAGSAMAENEKYLNSIAGKISQFQASFQAMSATIINSDFLGVLVDSGTMLLNVLNEILSVTGLIVPALTGGALVAFFKNLESLQNLGKASEALRVIREVADAADELKMLDAVPDAIREIVSGLDLDDAIDAFKRLGVSGDDLIDVLQQCGFETAEISDKLKTVGTVGSSNAGVLTKLKTAYSGLAASIGISTTALTAFIAVAAGIAVAVAAVQMYNQHIQKCVDNAREAASAWSSTNSSLDGHIEKIEELKTALESGTLSDEDAYNAKSELYSIQQQLIGSYGEQAAGIDLVNGKLSEQIGLIQQLSAAEANEFLNENYTGIEKATREMTKDRSLSLGKYAGVSSNDLELIEQLVDKYGEYLEITTRSGGRRGARTKQISFVGDVQEADEVLNQFATDIRNMSSEFDNVDLAENILGNISGKLTTVNEVLENYQSIYEQAQQAQLIADTTAHTYDGVAKTASSWLNEYADAVQKYNEALASGDPEAIKVAADEFARVDAAVNELTRGSMSQYAAQAADIADQLNKAAIAQQEFTDALADSKDAGFLKESGLDDVDFKAMLDTRGIQPYEAAFRNLIDMAVRFGVIADDSSGEIDKLVSLLVELGYISSQSTNSVVDGLKGIKNAASDATDATSTLLSGITGVQSILNAQTTGSSISLEEFDTAALNGYSDALEYNNGALQLNAEKVNALVKAKADEQIAHNDAAKALAQSEYLENAAEIEQLREQLLGLGAGEETLRGEIEANIDSLLAENGTLKSICTQYDLMSASIREATSAYQHWINAQNASQTGDMFDGALSALQHINNTLNNSESDLYGRIGRTDYQAAIDFIVPDSADKEDTDAVNSYIESISDMFTFDESGNQTGLNIANFCQRAVDAGLMVLNEAGTAYEIAGGKTMEDFATGLELAMPLVQAMFGELEEFGAKFDWADEANKTFGDLAVSATEAAEALRAIDGNEDLKINIDVTDIADKAGQLAALEETIASMQELKGDAAQIAVDPSQVEYANEVIKYCVAQKNLLEYQTVLAVDSSKITGELSNAIELMREFAGLQGQLAQAQALNLDTASIEADIADVAGKIQNIDADILADLNIDPASVDTISSSIQALTPEVLISAKVDPEAINGYQPEDKTATVVYDKDSTIPDEYEPDDKTATVTYYKISTSVDSYNPPNLTRYVTYYRQESGDVSVNGTAHASGTARANGDWGTAPGGDTLMGELGLEIVVDPRTGKWYTVGEKGAEFVNVPRGAIIFNHKQSESLLKYGYVAGRGDAMVSGTAMVSGSVPITGMWGNGNGSSGGNYGGSGNYHENQNNNSESDIAEDAKNAFEEAYKYHQHLLAMEQEDLEHYLRWLEEAYQDAYRNGEIELEDYYKYEEEVYEGRKELFQDYLNDLEFKIAGLERLDGTEGQIINLYLGMIKDIKTEIALARARGLDENDEYIQELLEQQRDYEDEIADIREDATDDAKGAVEDLIEYRIKMLKQDLENERDALEDKKDALKDFYDEQKDLLQQAYDDEKTLEERNEKRKAKTDIEAELDQLKFDDSAWAQKRKLELQEELSVAQKDLDDFEKEQALDNTQNLLDAIYEKQAAQIDAEIEAIEAQLNDPEALYNQALRDIQNNTQALYLEMVEYNAKYGDGNAETVKTMWDEAKASLDDFLDTFGRAYKDIILVASPGSSSSEGYATGTRSAAPGVKKVDEKGAEWLFTSGDGTKYRVFSGGEMVLNAEATKFLYDFAMDRGNALSNMFASLLNAVNLTSVGRQSQPIQLSTGDIIIQGNADQQTVSEIRRAQREGIDYILKQFTRLNK